MKPALEFHEPHGEWQSTGIEGQSEQILAADEESGVHTRFLRFEPGCDTAVAGTIDHDFWEEIYVIAGEILDTRLDQSFGAGYYACRPPGMAHGPWRSDGGALLFEVRYRGVVQD